MTEFLSQKNEGEVLPQMNIARFSEFSNGAGRRGALAKCRERM